MKMIHYDRAILESDLNQIIDDFSNEGSVSVWELKNAFLERVYERAKYSLKLKRWSAEHFMSLNAAFTFPNYLWENFNKYKSSPDIPKDTPDAPKLAIINCLKLSVAQTIQHYIDSLSCNESEKMIMDQHKKAIDWLEFCKEKNIVIYAQKFSLAIISSHYQLDEKIVFEKKRRPLTYNLKDAAGFLQEKLGYAVSEIRVLEYAVEPNSFGTYIGSGKYSFKEKDDYVPRLVSDVELAKESGIIEPDYEYPHDGLIRLKKAEIRDRHSLVSKLTVEHLRDGGKILLNRDKFLLRQLSLSEYILGHEYMGFIDSNEQLLEITTSDLLFVEEELLEFVDKQQKDVSTIEKPTVNATHMKISASLQKQIKGLINKGRQGQQMQLRANVLDVIIDAVKTLDKDFSPAKMPGTPQEFKDFCDRLTSKDFFARHIPTFRVQCKKHLNKFLTVSRKHHCKWGRPPITNKEYWDEISKKLFA